VLKDSIRLSGCNLWYEQPFINILASNNSLQVQNDNSLFFFPLLTSCKTTFPQQMLLTLYYSFYWESRVQFPLSLQNDGLVSLSQKSYSTGYIFPMSKYMDLYRGDKFCVFVCCTLMSQSISSLAPERSLDWLW
jgi:hypothetical protein